jgi:hypothetical protein
MENRITFCVPKLQEIASNPPGRVVYPNATQTLLIPENFFRGLQSRAHKSRKRVPDLIKSLPLKEREEMVELWTLPLSLARHYNQEFGKWRAAQTLLITERQGELREAA